MARRQRYCKLLRDPNRATEGATSALHNPECGAPIFFPVSDPANNFMLVHVPVLFASKKTALAGSIYST